ncbi:AAA family ATPase [Zavarzinia compransoris]|uniref:DNA primase/polymerase bifunctional N-terminal domain-containing protein n=1 Tax=Zavarzinia compransoris TaxID=1264899 RepID=A0A317E4W3_9PROT|nr:AAA family ATPase [Zavarzinia compransoris]PWR21691.1 hypothetical protein DKG75_06745 [Zavarzinia compransoris]TDP45523.1 RecA-family ATPase [Zavarzinia compransoris]
MSNEKSAAGGTAALFQTTHFNNVIVAENPSKLNALTGSVCHQAAMGGRWLRTIPIQPGTKRPGRSNRDGFPGWNKPWNQAQYEGQAAGWTAPAYKDFGVGVRCGPGDVGGGVFGLDLDALDEPLAAAWRAAAERELGATPFVRIGRAPKLLMVYRLAGEAVPAKLSLSKGEETAGVEFLFSGRQFVGSGVHPDTGKPYFWEDEAIFDARPEDVPSITLAQLETFREEARRAGEALGWRAPEGGQALAPAGPGRPTLPYQTVAEIVAAIEAGKLGAPGRRHDAALDIGLWAGRRRLDQSPFELAELEWEIETWGDGHIRTFRNGFEMGLKLRPDEAVERALLEQALNAVDLPTLPAPAAPAASAPRVVAASEWAGRAVVPARRLWWVMPRGRVTELIADGSSGKTTLAIQLALATARGEDEFLGVPMEAQGPAFLILAENDEDESHREMSKLAGGADRLADLDNRFHSFNLAGWDAALVREARHGIGPTARWREIETACANIHPVLIVFDAAADLFDASENDRAQVRHFMRALTALAMQYDAAVLLLRHPSRAGMRDGDGGGGSTAWRNSARASLTLEGDAKDPDRRVLTVRKANRSRAGEAIALRWTQGGYAATGDGKTLTDDRMKEVEAEFLALFERHSGRGLSASHTHPAGAPHIFAAQSATTSKAEFATAQERLISAERIKVVTEGPDSKRRQRLAWGAGQ